RRAGGRSPGLLARPRSRPDRAARGRPDRSGARHRGRRAGDARAGEARSGQGGGGRREGPVSRPQGSPGRHVRQMRSEPGREITGAQALEEAMIEEMERDERVTPFATVRASTLENKFGDRRVRFTPISEAAFTGIGLGAAGSGFRPVVNWGMVTFSF